MQIEKFHRKISDTSWGLSLGGFFLFEETAFLGVIDSVEHSIQLKSDKITLHLLPEIVIILKQEHYEALLSRALSTFE